MRLPLIAAISVAALLSACGGGSDGGSSEPTPAPAPTPGLSPTPTVFSAVSAGPLLAPISFDLNGDGTTDATSTTSAKGQFGQGVNVLQSSLGFGTVPTTATGRMSMGWGIDATTGLIVGHMSAPIGATIISPLTTLIDIQGSADSVRRALRLDAGPYAVRSETDLLQFNPALNWQNSDTAISQDAGRLTTINLQLLALAAYFTETPGDPVDVGVSLAKVSQHISGAMVTNATLDLTSQASIVALMAVLGPAPDLNIPTDWRDAKADLIAKYMTAMPVRIRDEADVRAWAYTFRFFILPELKILDRRWPNPAAARIAAIQPADIAEVAESFRSVPAPVVGSLMAVPDYREVTDSSSPPYSLILNDCAALTPSRLPTCSDWPIFRGPDSTELTAVQATEPGKLTASLTKGSIYLNRVGTFTGLTHVTYETRSASGDVATGTIFVRVREPD
ncbi:hypothetical protein FIM10_07805 [Sphingomonadales bacterium 56]|uniref:Uncharacterized protein n=1 Tax=Sphingobium agri TaxID=2933566 RepID=A0ABT0E341_9SPHN|nr:MULTISPECIES: hypothetical protein [Sphingobium]MBY2928578.1 hypothetical protein [Sphingomonadales bacterium 56]MBY2959574.1 hypothetical protein [Sphingomonadales bacterium 58]MCK0533592.1 hypothetical protein [Sphingobium agri]CAD7337591.1 hypothetical protein SPHS6_01577 [Sphingobium sp. S6]CAD7339267.1 hypothetical protein SPHS8_02535 [Sphingobium sp. S8]